MKYLKYSTIVILLFLLCGCGKDPVAQKMTEDINSLNASDDNYYEQVNKLIDRYNTLTDKQKSQVDNYADLLNAQDQLENVKNDINNDINNNSLSLEIERKYYHLIQDSIDQFKTIARNEGSYSLKGAYVCICPYDKDLTSGKLSDDSVNPYRIGIWYECAKGTSYMDIDYITYGNEEPHWDCRESSSKGGYGSYQMMASGHWNGWTESEYAKIYINSGAEKPNTAYIFELNLEDFISEGHHI